MEIVFVLVVIIGLVSITLSEIENNRSETKKNKINAKQKGEPIYKVKTSKGYLSKTISDDRDVMVVRGEVIDLKTGKTIYNEKESKAEKIRRYAEQKSKKLGYDFYPAYETNKHIILNSKIYGPLLQEMKTKRYFYLDHNPRISNKLRRVYQTIDQNGFLISENLATERIYDDSRSQMIKILSEAKTMA